MKLGAMLFREKCLVSFGRRGGGGVVSVVRDATAATLLSADSSVATIPPADASLAGVMPASAHDALDRLATAVQTGGTGRLGHLGQLSAMALRAETTTLRIDGFAAPGDGGEATWRRVPSEPIHVLKRRSLDRFMPDGSESAAHGGWWTLSFEGRHDVRQAGARADGVSDDTAAVQALADFLATHADAVVASGTSLTKRRKAELVIPAGSGAVISATVTIGNNIRLACEGPILVKGTANATPTGAAWLVIGEPTATFAPSRQTDHVIDIRRQTLSSWTAAGDVGVQIVAAASACHLSRIDGFRTGAVVTLPYGTTTLGEFRDNRTGLVVRQRMVQFTNQGQFIGGEFACVGSANPGLSRYGIAIEVEPGASKINALSFIGQSFELNAAGAGAGEAVPYLVADTSEARFVDQRSEGNGPVFARLSGDCRYLDFRVNAVSATAGAALDDQSSHRIGNTLAIASSFDPARAFPVFDSGRLIDRTYRYIGGSGAVWAIRGLDCLTNRGPSPTPPSFELNGTLTGLNHRAGTIVLGTGIWGVRVDTSVVKTLALAYVAPAGHTLTPQIVAFDAEGVQVTGPEAVLRNTSSPATSANAGVFGGLYSAAGSYNTDERIETFAVGATVASVFVGIGGNGSEIAGFRLFSIGGPTVAWSRSERDYQGRIIVSGLPTAAGAWRRGQIVWTVTPTASAAPGWVCVESGQFGSLNGGATTASGTAGNGFLDVNTSTDLAEGMRITVAGQTHEIRRVSGNRVHLAATLTVGFTDAAVANAAPVFKAMPALAA